MPDFINQRAKRLPLALFPFGSDKRAQSAHEFLHPVAPQRGTGHHRKRDASHHLPRKRGKPERLVVALFEQPVHQAFVPRGDFFNQRLAHPAARKPARVDYIRGKQPLHLRKRFLRVRALTVDFIEKNQRRHAVFAQQAENRLRVALHALGAADYDHCRVHHGNRPLHFGRKIGVSGRIHPENLIAVPFNQRLIGENRNAALPLNRVRVEKRVAVIDPAHRADGTGKGKHALGKRRLARVHVREHANGNLHAHIVPAFAARRKVCMSPAPVI